MPIERRRTTDDQLDRIEAVLRTVISNQDFLLDRIHHNDTCIDKLRDEIRIKNETIHAIHVLLKSFKILGILAATLGSVIAVAVGAYQAVKLWRGA